jgi:ligand-binding sensor domain-containing protein
MKKGMIYSTLMIILLVSNSVICAQKIYFNRVAPPDGNTFMHITGIVQDQQGYMWFASKKGLFRYDGYEIVHYKNFDDDSNTLATNALEAIAVDSSGIIWIATFGGLGLDRFDPRTSTFAHIRHDSTNAGSLASNNVSALLVDHEGTLWVGSDAGLDRYDAHTGTFIHYRSNTDDPNSLSCDQVRAIYEDRQGELWIGTGNAYIDDVAGKNEGGLNRLNKQTGRFIRYLSNPKDPHCLINNKVRAIFEDSKGNFWIGTAGDGLHIMDKLRGTFTRYRYDPANPEKLSRPEVRKELGYDHITFITEDVSGTIWIGTVGAGLNNYDPVTHKTTHYELEKDTAGAFTDREVWTAYTSREGVLWISTINGNLYRLNPRQRDIAYQKTKGACVFSFFEEPDGTLWTATTEGLIVQRKSGDVTNYTHQPHNKGSLSSNVVVALKRDRSGRIWVGSEGGLDLWDRQSNQFIHYRNVPENKESLSSNFVVNIYEDRSDNLWVGTFKGLNLMNRDNGSFSRYIFHPEDTTSQNLNIVTSVLEDREGKMWIGCAMVGDVHELNKSDGTFKTFLKGYGIQSFCEDQSGSFWVAGDEGLFRYDKSKHTFIRHLDSGLGTNFSKVRSLLEDSEKNLWLGTENGIFKLNPERQLVRQYGKTFGVNGNTLCHRSIYQGNEGQLYFGNYSGYLKFFPQQLSQDNIPPQIIFSSFRLADNTSPVKDLLSNVNSIQLRHNQNSFTFEFAGIDFAEPESNRHYFMLEAYDKKWNRAGSDRKAVYFNVPPGKYIFRVKSINSKGVSAERSVNVVVVPPWWSMWWFRVPAVIFVFALLYGIIRWRMNQKFRLRLERSEKEKQVAELQQQKTELEMQALRAQMNPHFIFNSLNSINRFILQNNKTQASEYLAKFSRLVRLILLNSQSPLIPLANELEALQLYLELEALRFEQRFDFRITLDGGVDDAMIKVPPLVIQPFTENAIWHGLMHKEEKGHLNIKLFIEDDALCCMINDDGIGRNHAAQIKNRDGNTHRSMGMRITADRIALMKQKSLVHASIVVNDIVQPDGNPGGTEVIIKLPVVYD